MVNGEGLLTPAVWGKTAKRDPPTYDHDVVHLPRRIDLTRAIGLLASRFVVFYCVNSNARAIALQKQLRAADMGVIHRVVSKARHLVEYLQKNDIHDFEVQYKAAASPYAAAQVDQRATIERLHSALTAKGLSHINGLDAEGLVTYALEGRASPRIDATSFNVGIITTPNLLARTLSWRAPWWVSMGLQNGERWVSIDEHREGGKWVPLLGRPVIVIFENPKLDEFDTERPVDTDCVEGLRAKHDLFEENGQWYERRPREQLFGLGVRRGCASDALIKKRKNVGSAARALVLTNDAVVANKAANTLVNARLWHLRHRHLPYLQGM